MADVTQNIIIEFSADISQLQPAVDKLADIGKVEKTTAEAFKSANTEINKQQQALSALGAINNQINNSGKVTKKNLEDISKAVKSMSGDLQKEFKTGITEVLQQAGVEAEEFEKILGSSLGKSEESTVSLRQQLRGMIEQLAQMKVAGKDTTAEYAALAQQAGQLKDAIGDANQEVRNFGSDTSTIDGVISAVSGLAGGFAVVQGAAALFGDESEELQKTLLRVNAAMAILQGLQQIQNVLQKESAAATLASTIATKVQTAAQRVFAVVVGTSTGALKAFKIALASTGVGLLIIGLGLLISKISEWVGSTESATEAQERLKVALDAVNDSLEDNLQALSTQAQKEEQILRRLGATEEEMFNNRKKFFTKEQAELFSAYRQKVDIYNQELAAGKLSNERLIELREEAGEALEDYNRKTEAKELDRLTFLADNAEKERELIKKGIEDNKKLREERLQKEKEARAAGFADAKAYVELQLLNVEKGSEEELNIRKNLLRAELQQALDNEKLTINERKLLVQTFFKERLDLEKQFLKDREALQLENVAADLQADILALEISNSEKLELTESLINLTAEMEITAAEGNASKIALINANRDKAIRDARIASIQETAEYEIALAQAVNGAYVRELQFVTSNSEASAQVRIDGINELAAIESAAIQKRIDALNQERSQGLISQKEYNLRYAQLTDEQLKVWEDAERAKTDITEDEEEKRREANRKTIDQLLQAAAVVTDVLSSLYSLQADKENQRLAEQRQKLKDLQEAGAITEKEALARTKRLDAEERKIKNQQAQRDKQIAVFKALLAIPEAYLQGLSQGGPILGAIYGALAAVQAAIVIARPIPKFAKGKKDNYEGLGEVGEAGTELIEKDGRMYLADKPQVIWLGKKDKVFNPAETLKMLAVPTMSTERGTDKTASVKIPSIDYEKLGEAVGRHTKTNVYVDGVQEQGISKQLFEKYLNARRSF